MTAIPPRAGTLIRPGRTWRNFGRNQACVPAAWEHPTTEAELVDVVRRAADRCRTVKAVGSGHSYSAIGFTECHLLDLSGYARVLAADRTTGTLGYVAAGLELADQVRALDLDVARVVAASTAGTATGLVLGLAAAGLDALVDIACVDAEGPTTESTLRTLLAGTAALLDVAVPGDDRWSVTDATFGPGYGVPTPEAQAAIARVAQTEGVLLDPVYTGKAMAHLVDRIEATAWPADRDVVFVHTGGAPGLFAYSPTFGSP